MTGAWNSQQGRMPLAARMADLALRAQRLIVTRRLAQLEVLIRSQAPELRRIPGGRDAVIKAQEQLQEARQRLQQLPEVPHG